MPTEPSSPLSLPPAPAGVPDPRPAVEVILRHCPTPPRLALVLGSGFASVADAMTEATSVGFSQLPGFAVPGVPGHPGRLLVGRIAGMPAVVLQGRLHSYEGHDAGVITFPIRVLAALGIQHLLLTNAAGGIREDLQPGDLVVVSDHLNALGMHPLRGVPPPAGFIDLSEVYSRRLRTLLAQSLGEVGRPAHEGIYAAMPGPAFETPAEIRALRVLGADLVGMSTVAEAIVARQCGLETAALSCVTNRAAGLGGRISHEEVMEVGRRVEPVTREVLKGFARRLALLSPA